jgi:hypothetical protein
MSGAVVVCGSDKKKYIFFLINLKKSLYHLRFNICCFEVSVNLTVFEQKVNNHLSTIQWLKQHTVIIITNSLLLLY